MLPCDTGATLTSVPTKHPRHAVTETPEVKAVLDELRTELGDHRLAFGELVVLGAQEKLARLRSETETRVAARRRLTRRIAGGNLGIDREAAESVRRTGWTRPL